MARNIGCNCTRCQQYHARVLKNQRIVKLEDLVDQAGNVKVDAISINGETFYATPQGIFTLTMNDDGTAQIS